MIVPGTPFPAFKTTACVGLEPGQEFRTISSQDFPGKWLVLYTYPKDFTFVCPTEIVEFDDKVPAFAERSAVVLGGSTDNEYSHLAWRREHSELRRLAHPLLFVNPDMAARLGVLHPTAGVALRATFIVDPENTIQHVTVNNLNVGRSPEETLRILDGLQTDELCPCNRDVGGEVLKAA